MSSEKKVQVQAANWPRKIGLSFCCQVCSGTTAIVFPAPLEEVIQKGKDFMEEHSACTAKEEDLLVIHEGPELPPISETGSGGEESQQEDQPVDEGSEIEGPF